MSEPFPDTSVEIEERITSYFNCARRSREDYFAVAEELGGLTLERPLVTQPFGSKRPVPIMALQPAELMRGIATAVLKRFYEPRDWEFVIMAELTGACRIIVTKRDCRPPCPCCGREW